MNFLHRMTQAKNFKTVVIVVFLLLSAMVWLGLRVYSHYYLSTDDAYINANVVQIAPRTTGKVIKTYVSDNQFVNKGDPLFDLDPEPFQASVDSAQAQVAMNEALLTKAQGTSKRTVTLVEKKFLSPQNGDNVLADLKTAAANLQYAQAGLTTARLNLQYTKVLAPTSGWITNFTLRVGDVVSINQPLFALIDNSEFWADANFKETEMAAIKPGQTATIVTDLYPHHPFKAVVESISGGAGSAFSLLPPQNATGNWVKVTQRIPVRVRLIHAEEKFPLRIGISATATINLRSLS